MNPPKVPIILGPNFHDAMQVAFSDPAFSSAQRVVEDGQKNMYLPWLAPQVGQPMFR
jgi:hypothetical protein